MSGPIIYFDLETGGLELTHPIIQLAAIAISDFDGAELATFNVRLQFDEAACNPEALEINHYKREDWADAIPPLQAAYEFQQFLNRFKWVEKLSKAGNKYVVAKLAGYNAAAFDMPRLRHNLFSTMFLPADPTVLDVYQLAVWFYELHFDVARPESLKLEALAKHFDIEFKAHDALEDCRATAKVAQALKYAMNRSLVATRSGILSGKE